jgi:hypothetical protein
MPAKTKSLSRRKPRISRSKVISRLASQRAAMNLGGGVGSVGAGGRLRSSLGLMKQSLAGKRGSDVMLSAKKRARQSEYVRRRSRAGVEGANSKTMDVDG